MSRRGKYAPIVVTVYDRLQRFKECINSLLSNELAKYSDIYIISDAPKCKEHQNKIDAVREYAKTISGFEHVHLIFNKENLGSYKSGYKGLLSVLQENDCFIFLEDDIIVSRDFLQYMNDGLLYYEDDPRIYAICGFCLPFIREGNYKEDVWFSPVNSPWGYATWKKKWLEVDYSYFDRYSELKKDWQKYKEFTSVGFYIKGILQADSRREIEASDLRVYYHMFQHHMCSVFPVVSKTQNWGFDGTGEHCGNKNAWWAKPELDTRNQPTRFIPFSGYDKELLRNHRKFQDKINGGIVAKYLKYTWVHRLWKRIKKLL